VLQFHREPLRTPHLVVIDGGRASERSRRGDSLAVLAVVLATIVALAVDLTDGALAWSPYAVAVSVVVLAAHAVLVRRS
jgi:hypothetical protein